MDTVHPFTIRDNLMLSDFGIDPLILNKSGVTMDSDNLICTLSESEDHIKKLLSVIDIAVLPPQVFSQRVKNAEFVRVSPHRIVAVQGKLKGGTSQDCIRAYNTQLKKRTFLEIDEEILFWKWITPVMLCVVTKTTVYHWSSEGDTSSLVKMFNRAEELENNQIVNYVIDSSAKWLALVGIDPSQTERPQLIKGTVQLFSVDEQSSRIFGAHAASFASRTVPGHDKESILILFANKTSDAMSKLQFIELVAQNGKPEFTKKELDLVFPSDCSDDSAISVQSSKKFSLVFVITNLGLLFVYDSDTGTHMYTKKISSEPIVLASEASVGDLCAINKRGQVILVVMNKSTIVNFIREQIQSMEPAAHSKMIQRFELAVAESLPAIPRTIAKLQSFPDKNAQSSGFYISDPGWVWPPNVEQRAITLASITVDLKNFTNLKSELVSGYAVLIEGVAHDAVLMTKVVKFDLLYDCAIAYLTWKVVSCLLEEQSPSLDKQQQIENNISGLFGAQDLIQQARDMWPGKRKPSNSGWFLDTKQHLHILHALIRTDLVAFKLGGTKQDRKSVANELWNLFYACYGAKPGNVQKNGPPGDKGEVVEVEEVLKIVDDANEENGEIENSKGERGVMFERQMEGFHEVDDSDEDMENLLIQIDLKGRLDMLKQKWSEIKASKSSECNKANDAAIDDDADSDDDDDDMTDWWRRKKF